MRGGDGTEASARSRLGLEHVEQLHVKRTSQPRKQVQHPSSRSNGPLTSSTAQQNLPQATLALSEYSEMAIFSSTRWSAKLSGLQRDGRTVGAERGESRSRVTMLLTREPWRRRRRRWSEYPGSWEGTLTA